MIATLIEAIKMAAKEEKNPELKKLVDVILKGFEPEQKPQVTEIFEYLTKRHGKKDHKVGVVVGFKEGDKVLIGWSKCNFKKGDQFDRETGIELAKQKALGLAPAGTVPAADVRQLTEFQTRCVRYFKDAKSIQLAR